MMNVQINSSKFSSISHHLFIVALITLRIWIFLLYQDSKMILKLKYCQIYLTPLGVPFGLVAISQCVSHLVSVLFVY